MQRDEAPPRVSLEVSEFELLGEAMGEVHWNSESSIQVSASRMKVGLVQCRPVCKQHQGLTMYYWWTDRWGKNRRPTLAVIAILERMYDAALARQDVQPEDGQSFSVFLWRPWLWEVKFQIGWHVDMSWVGLEFVIDNAQGARYLMGFGDVKEGEMPRNAYSKEIDVPSRYKVNGDNRWN